MKRLLVVIILLIFGIMPKLSAGPFMDFGIAGGISVPDDEIANVMNTDSIIGENFVGELKNIALNTGYHLSARIRLDLTKSLKFYGSAGINRFPQTEILVEDPESGELLGTLKTTINVIPITTGVNWYLIDKGIGIYAIGDLTYNYISHSLDIIREGDGVAIPVSSSGSENTIGYGLGAGIDFDLFLGRLNLEGKYNRLNIISFEENSETKDYFTLTLGIYF
jgi:opacity protein-like surface antigen